jgi:2-hydroxychromene-2-carboxylate isomerase
VIEGARLFWGHDRLPFVESALVIAGRSLARSA